MLERSLHLPIKPGVVAAWDTRTVVIIALCDGSFARVRDVASGEEHHAAVDELHGIPALEHIERDESRWAQVRNSTSSEWKQARRRERILNRCLSGEHGTSDRIAFACNALDLSRRTIYRLLANYRAAAQTTTLIQKHRGTPPASRRLSAEREAIAMRCIEQRFLGRPWVTVTFVAEEIERQCRAADSPVRSARSVSSICPWI